MKLLFAQQKTSHLFALFCATIVHASIAAWSMMPSNPIVINQQAIQVSFVAPSGENQNDSRKKTIIKNEKFDQLNFLKLKNLENSI